MENEREKKRKRRKRKRERETIYIFRWHVVDVTCWHAGAQMACSPVVLMAKDHRCSGGQGDLGKEGGRDKGGGGNESIVVLTGLRWKS